MVIPASGLARRSRRVRWRMVARLQPPADACHDACGAPECRRKGAYVFRCSISVTFRRKRLLTATNEGLLREGRHGRIRRGDIGVGRRDRMRGICWLWEAGGAGGSDTRGIAHTNSIALR